MKLGGLTGLASAALPASIAFPHGAAAQSTPGVPRSPESGRFDVRLYGARGDGNEIDSTAINAAIAAASVHGGGTVFFPAGTYLCYSLHLKSRVALCFDQGATLIAAHPTAAHFYDPAEAQDTAIEPYQDYGHNHWHNSLLWGEDLHEVSIYGPGIIRGDGLVKGDDQAEAANGSANKAIALKNCRNVLLRDFTVRKGGHFGILATGVDNLTIDNLLIDVERDGMDIDCCRNVRVSNCSVNSPFDDGIVLKTSYALGAARGCEQVTITNCFVTGKYEVGSFADGKPMPFKAPENVTPTGRIKLGTESNGPFRNIAISNCVFEGCQGLALESVDGGALEDIAITNITMRDLTSEPIFIRLGNRLRGPRGVDVGTLRRVLIANLTCSNTPGGISSIITGIPNHPIEDLTLSEIVIYHAAAGPSGNTDGGAAHGAHTLPEAGDKYPDTAMFGPTPSRGFFVRHVRRLTMTNVRVAATSPDARPALVFNDVQQAFLFHVETHADAPVPPGAPTLVLENVSDIRILASRPIPDTQLDEAEAKNL